MVHDFSNSATSNHSAQDSSNSHAPTRQQSEPAATDQQGSQNGYTQNTTSPRSSARTPRSKTPKITPQKVMEVAAARKINPKFVERAASRVNSAIQHQNKHLTDRGLYLALATRFNSIYSRELGARQWKAAHGAIYKAKIYNREVINKSVLPALNDDAKALLQLVIDDTYGSFRKAWSELQRPARAWAWQRLAIWLLQNDPKKALDFLIVTSKPQDKPDFTMVADCFIYLDRFHYDDWLRDWRHGSHTYASAVASCLDPTGWPIISPPQLGMRLFIRRSDFSALMKGFRIINERGITLSAETALCLMNKFTELNNVELAFSALEFLPKIKDPNFTMTSEGVVRHCCKLLTLDTVEDKAEGRNFRILPRLLKMGVQPDRDMLNVVLANAYKTGDPQLGEDILRFMQNHNHEPDSYTYLTLLTDAVARGDRGRVDELVQEVELQDQLKENPYIFSKIFHAHFTFTAKHMDPETDPAGVFYSMLDMYNKLHDISPLKELLLIPPQYTSPSTGLETKTPPSPVALFLMLATFFRCRNRVSQVHRMYDQFRELVQMGHPSIAPLVESDHVYNEFLIAFRKSPRGLRSSIRLVEDMLDPSSLPTETSDGKRLKHTAPTPRTWTILLSAFNYNRQPDAAEKVKEMMAKHNVKYNQVTWNTIINGFANTQNIPETAAAIRQMEQQGFAIDHYTMKSLRYLRDPERLWVSIEEMDQAYGPDNYEPPAREPMSDVHNGQEERDLLIDSGLEKLGSKSKPKI
ncbi:uncharacterized protein N7529_004636 [Penicillium soppii]|uniref:uncharacterized protein n=1 Tax=Penicillium soppii TaxID=69789 RepID=UPI002547D9ED|nr:uncharacterized protein N7529_004636 [Penicillium soppii]KAJ5872283.1 hypothetical protein N7529_004636 [Penicillium soppii]